MSRTNAGAQAAEAESGNYDVGYGRPPAQHRFRKGASGNPNGRPRSSTRPPSQSQLVEDAFLKAASEPIVITRNGRRARVTRIEALAHQVVAQALKGDPRSTKLLVDNLSRIQAKQHVQPTHEDWLDYLDETPKQPESIVVQFVAAGRTARDSDSELQQAGAEPS